MRRNWVTFFSVALTFSLVLSIMPGAFGQTKPIPGETYNLSEYQRLFGKKISQFNEAPDLSNLVKQKKLLPVKK